MPDHVDETTSPFTENPESEFRVKSLDALVGSFVPAWLALPTVTSAERCVFLVNQVAVNAEGDPEPVGIGRFVERLRMVMVRETFTGRLAPVVSIPLVRIGDHDRVLLAAYLESPKTREQLNALFGEELFAEEGSLGEEL